MFRFLKWLPCVAALAGAIMLGTASPARADIELTLTSGSTTSVQSPINTGPVAIPLFTGSNGLIMTTATGTSNSPGGPFFTITSAGIGNTITLGIQNPTAFSQTVTITVSAQGFTSPNSPPPVNVFDTVSGTVVNGTVTGTAQGFASATNTLYGAGNATLPGTAFPGALLTFSATGLTSTASFSTSGTVGGFSPGGTYSLTFTETLTLSAGANVQLTGGNVQTSAVPAPAGIVLALAGLPFLGIGTWVRRRKAKVAG